MLWNLTHCGLGAIWPSLSPCTVINPILLTYSLWPSDTIWWQGSWSTLAQVMVCCQAITCTNVDLSSKLFCGTHLRAISQEVFMTLIHDMFEGYTVEITTTSPRGQWVQLQQKPAPFSPVNFRPCFCTADVATMQISSRAHFTKSLRAHSPNLVKICNVLSYRVMIRSGLNFVHAMTAQRIECQ